MIKEINSIQKLQHDNLSFIFHHFLVFLSLLALQKMHSFTNIPIENIKRRRKRFCEGSLNWETRGVVPRIPAAIMNRNGKFSFNTNILILDGNNWKMVQNGYEELGIKSTNL